MARKGKTANEVFKEAGGKDLKRDRKRTSKKVVESVKEYKKIGAKKSDLSGLDTEDSVFIDTADKTERERILRSIDIDYFADFEERASNLTDYMILQLNDSDLKKIVSRPTFRLMLQKAYSRDPTLKYMLDSKAYPSLEEALWYSRKIKSITRFNLNHRRVYVNDHEARNILANTDTIRKNLRSDKNGRK